MHSGASTMRKVFITSIFLVIISSGYTQVRVLIKDHQTGSPLAGVTITDKQNNITTVSTESGVVELTLLKFPAQLSASHIGYQTRTLEIPEAGSYDFQLYPEASNLEEVVVTGQFEPQSVSKSVFKVRTISMETIQARGATRLQDVLNTELNFRFSTDPALGVSKIEVQGLTGQNVKVLINGLPVIGRQGTENAIDINQININTIERIEIIEGPMSTIYGADALAGVINIITKKPEQDKLTGSVRVSEESIGTEYSLFKRGIHQQNIALQHKAKSFFALADFGHNYSGGWQGDSTGREKTFHPKRQWLASGTVGLQQENWNVSYRLDFLNEDLYNPAEYISNKATDQNYLTTRFMHQLQGMVTLSHRFSFNTAIAYTDYKRRTQTVLVDKVTGEETLSLGRGQQDTTKFDGLTFRATAQYKINDYIQLQPGVEINLESGSGGRLLMGTNSMSDYAAFLSAELKPFSFLTVRPGFRFVKNSVYQAPPVLPSLNTKFQLGARHDLRLSYGRGFRAPSLRELYLFFYDSNHNIEGNPDLEAELSDSYNISWNWQVVKKLIWRYNLSLSSFYNDVDNMIEYVPKLNSPVTTYGNFSKYKTQGVTWVNNLVIAHLTASLGGGITGRYNQYYADGEDMNRFTWSPEINGSFSYLFARAGVTANVYYKFTGITPRYVQGTSEVYLAETEAYHWADFSLQKTFLNKLSAVAGSRNLFNVTQILSTAVNAGAHGGGGANPLSSGRSYYVTLTYNF